MVHATSFTLRMLSTNVASRKATLTRVKWDSGNPKEFMLVKALLNRLRYSSRGDTKYQQSN
ncbi:hypothetical protein Ancab_029088 [Ancistrocladus abbreviatus]